MNTIATESETKSTKTTNKTQRSQTERAKVSREALEIFENDDWLKIPSDVENRFQEQGYGLMWVRIMLQGQDDFQNIGRKEREGWEFVQADECPEMASGFRVLDKGRLAGCIVRGDVALARQPIEYGNARRQAMTKRVNDLEEAVNARLHGDRPDRRAPITDSSKTTVSKGKAANFDT